MLCEVVPTFSPCGCSALHSRKGIVLSGEVEERGGEACVMSLQVSLPCPGLLCDYVSIVKSVFS